MPDAVPLKTFSRKDVQARTASAPLTSTANRVEDNSTIVVPLPSPEEYVRKIETLWREAQKRFVAIGKYLLLARERHRGEFEKTILPRLSFKRAVAHQLMSVAEALKEQRFREEELPRSYSAAYHLTLIPENRLSLARERLLVRPEASRSEIKSFLDEIRVESGTASDRRLVLLRRRDSLVKKVAKLTRELSAIQAELGKTGPTLIDGEVDEDA
jgi:hypothetical protein